MTLYEKFRNLRDAFVACFERGEWFTDQQTLTVHAQRVMFELKEFCRANETTFDVDARVHALKEGRRETLLRIQHYLNLSDIDLMKLQDPDRERKEDHE